MSFFFFVYRWCLAPLLRFAFWIMARTGHSKVRVGYEMRQPLGGVQPWLAWKPGLRPIWFHCASGEFEYAKPVITRLKAQHPDLKVLVTYFSPTFAKAVQGFPGVDFACPSPWEDPGSLREFLGYHQPQALLIARTDTWPEMLRQAKVLGLPTLLFAATLSPTSSRARGLGRLMSRAAFQNLDQIFCVTEEDRATFESLGFGDRAQIAGDTRYDQVIARLQLPRALRKEAFLGVSPASTLVAGSTWPQDEDVLIEAAVRMKGVGFRWILVPHEPTADHLETLETRLATSGLSSVRYSQAVDGFSEVLLVDQIGILAELYQRAAFAFVGGSFRKTVHSVMEPLAAGCLTTVGPLHLNNREALEFKRVQVGNLACVTEVRDAASLVNFLERARGLDLAAQIRDEVQARSGSSEKVLGWLKAHELDKQ